MKRIIATILVALMLTSTAYATATFEYNAGKIGDLNVDTSVKGNVTSYLYNGSAYSFAVNDKDFEKLNQLFSDRNLTNSQKSFDEPMTGNMSDYPKGGKYTIKGLYDNENKYNVTLEFAFDSKGVLFSEIFLSTVSTNHVFRQGYYTYNSSDVYSQIKSILDGYAKIEEEKDINDKYELKASELKISDLEILYTATFSDSELSINGDNKWTWGICSYKYENGETVTRAYLSLIEDDNGIKYFIVSDTGLQKSNTIHFNGNNEILFYGNENFGKENTKGEILYSFELQFNVTDELQIEHLVYSHSNQYINVSQTIDIDMDNYVGNKTLPKLSAFQFSSSNNVMKEIVEDNKEDIKSEEKVEEIEEEQKEETGKTETEDKEEIKEQETEEKKEENEETEALTFEELTGLSRDDIDHIVIRSGINGAEYSTAYEKVITEIYDAVNTKTFNSDVKEDNGDGWSYEILFFDKDTSGISYIMPGGTVVKGVTYKTSNEEKVKKVVENAYNLIANDCSEWSADYIAQAKDLGFLQEITDVLYKENITREKFCEIVYNMLMKTANNGIAVPSAFYFEDTYNSKVSALYYTGIINGKGDRIFAPDDYLTREEAATILYRVAEFLEIDMPQSEYDESIPYYQDKEAISEWAFNAVFYMREMGIMVGTSETEFSPKEAYTAEQAVATVIRMYTASCN